MSSLLRLTPPPAGSGTPLGTDVTYQVLLDINRNGLFDHAKSNITSRVKQLYWRQGFKKPYESVAPPSQLSLTLNNADGALYQDKPTAEYYGLITPGMLVRLSATFRGARRTLYTGKLETFRPTAGAFGESAEREVAASVGDMMLRLLDAEFTPQLLTNVTTDVALGHIFEKVVVAWPYEGAFWVLNVSQLGVDTKLYGETFFPIVFEVGRTALPYVGDTADKGKGVSAQSYLREVMAAEAGGRFFWDGRASAFRFHSRLHDVESHVAATFTENDLTAGEVAFGDDVANVVHVQYTPRKVGTPGTVIFESDAVPFRLYYQQERTIVARFRDPDNPNARIAAKDIIPPVRGVDVVASAVHFVIDPSQLINVTFEPAAQSAKITIRNPQVGAVNITKVQLRGTPLTAYSAELASAYRADSIADTDRRTSEPLNLGIVADAEFAQNYADFRAEQMEDVATHLRSVRVRGNKSEALMTQVLDRTIGDRIRITDSISGHDREYIIVGEEHFVDTAAKVHDVNWSLQRAIRTDYWRLGTSRLNIDARLFL